ncbi:P-loop containing nucleoside triphosphate hydrolase protein [Wallemia mellicola]|uniref:P-loop containing nucleoside triphosphate hydrolase protein n=1 Tax=Wallemia mellicola TaxID=1708541 RepID=A0A4T0QSN0_9BASI|nr:P-loop containing nucleoside triphosphate hydrolase protein [Wallemia mellicola]
MMDSANSVNIAIEEDKKDKSSVSFFALWKYSNGLEKFINLVALVAAIGAGTGLPLMTIVLRDFTDSFVEFGSAIQSSQANIDEITQKFKTDTNSTAIYFIYIAVGVAVLTYIFLSAFVITGETVAGTVRKEYFKSILHQDISYFDNIGAGEIVDRIQAQTLLLQDAAFVIGFILEWRLTLVTAAIFPVIMIVGTASEMFSSKYQSRALEGQSKASSIAEEALSSIRNAHSLNYQKQLNQLFGKHASEVKNNNLLNAIVWGISMSGFYFTSNSAYALAFWFGITLTIWGYTQAGTVIAVFFCVVIGSFALTMAPTHMQAFALAQNAAANIYPTIEDDNAISARADEGLRPSTDTLLGHIAFDAVDFIYPSRPSVTVLKGFSVDILPGKSIALVGSSGSGKSTVVSILERFYKPKSGSVTLDGYVGQEPVLFSCSIKENVEYGLIGTEFENKSADVKFQLVQEACKKANAHDFVCELPEGYETDVGNRGFLLSGGQKQRIAIARAIVSNPKILILDEATSALDTLSENVVQKALDNASTGRTTISIAHRLSTIKNADSILVMKQGTIVEQGTHDDLIQIQDGIYAGLVAMQNLDQDSSKPQMILPSQVLSKEDEKGSVSSDMKELVRKDGNEIILDTTDKKYGLFRIIMRLGKLNQNDWLIYIIAFIACAGSDNDSDLRNDGNRQALFFTAIAIVSFFTFGISNWGCMHTAANLSYKLRMASFENLLLKDSAAEAALNIIDYEPLIDTNATAKSEANNITGHIRFENVFFKYPTRPEVQVLSGVDLDVKPGQIAALVGASGCGKSSTIQLLERFYDVQFGKITIDGTDIREFNVKDYRKNIALVHKAKTDVIEACKAANIHDFIERLPDGYKTDVGGRGLSLSGGQKQRIAIARAFIRNPKILLLDEATSALDSESEKVVQNALEIASRGRTTVTVAHRLASIKNADVIYVYHNGGIAEKGTHSELISKRGFYYAMFKEQQLSS